MNHINVKNCALTVGFMFSGVHIFWSILVLTNLAQPLIDFIMWAHMIHMQRIVGEFDLTAAVTLIVVTFLVGALVGKVFAMIWNKVHKK